MSIPHIKSTLPRLYFPMACGADAHAVIAFRDDNIQINSRCAQHDQICTDVRLVIPTAKKLPSYLVGNSTSGLLCRQLTKCTRRVQTNLCRVQANFCQQLTSRRQRRRETSAASEVEIQSKAPACFLFLGRASRHHASFLVLSNPFLEEVGLPLQRDQLHPVERIGRAEQLRVAQGCQ